jgi:hypothetical protein
MVAWFFYASRCRTYKIIYPIQQTCLVLWRIIRLIPIFTGDALGKNSHLIFGEIQYTNTYNIIQCALLIQAVISEKHLHCHFNVSIQVVKSYQKVTLAVIAGSLGHASSSYSSVLVIILETSFTKVIKIYICFLHKRFT